MEIELILSFLAASILLTIMPGPDNLFVLTESLTKGSKNGILISIGLCLGVLVHTIAAATGLSIFIQNSAIAFSVIKYLGAAYLFYLAYKALGEKQAEIDLDLQRIEVEDEVFPLIRKGFLMNVLNPKVSIFFIAFLPQFISHNGFNLTLQMVVLGLIFMIQAIIIFSLISILSSKLTPYLTSSKFWNITKWSKVSILTLLGITLALARK